MHKMYSYCLPTPLNSFLYLNFIIHKNDRTEKDLYMTKQENMRSEIKNDTQPTKHTYQKEEKKRGKKKKKSILKKDTQKRDKTIRMKHYQQKFRKNDTNLGHELNQPHSSSQPPSSKRTLK